MLLNHSAENSDGVPKNTEAMTIVKVILQTISFSVFNQGSRFVFSMNFHVYIFPYDFRMWANIFALFIFSYNHSKILYYREIISSISSATRFTSEWGHSLFKEVQQRHWYRRKYSSALISWCSHICLQNPKQLLHSSHISGRNQRCLPCPYRISRLLHVLY